MIQNIFYGDVGRNNLSDSVQVQPPVTLNGEVIRVPTPDMSAAGNPKKLDILMYNNINRYGEILRSAVFISEIKDSDDTSEIVYNPTKRLNKSDTELSMTVSGDSFRWFNADVVDTEFRALSNESRGVTNKFKRFDTSTDIASLVGTKKHMYDGWFSLVSISPDSLVDSIAVDAGTLREKSGSIEYALQDNPTNAAEWSSILDVTSSIPLFNFIDRNNLYEPFLKYDFFVALKSNTIYHDMVTKKLDGEWFIKLSAIRPKLRSIYSFSNNKEFKEAQFLVNSINLTLASLIT